MESMKTKMNGGKRRKLRDRDRVGVGEAEKDVKARSPGRLHEEPPA